VSELKGGCYSRGVAEAAAGWNGRRGNALRQGRHIKEYKLGLEVADLVVGRVSSRKYKL
jgi:hypothetical protein